MSWSDDATAIRPGEEINTEAVLAFVAQRGDELELPETPESIDVLQFTGGRANLTYLIRVSNREFVLRRPPLGKVGVGAHDMGREFHTLSRLWRVFDRAPRAFCFCEDAAIIGAPFFIMERCQGAVIRYEIPEEMQRHADVERRVSFALVDAMTDLHSADYAAAGLSDLGKPEGFLERQLAGWIKRWESSKHQNVADFDRLAVWLRDNLPTQAKISLIHNDPKLDNCQFDPDNPDRVNKIFDWDMATIGHSLIDLGTLLAYWAEAQCQARGQALSPLSIFAKPGFPSRDEIAQHYAKQSGADLAEINWYEAFATWKSAVVVQQIYARYLKGQTRDQRFMSFGERVPEMLALGLRRAVASL